MSIFQRITTEDAKKIMDSEENYKIVDVRTHTEYKNGHIIGAICVPDEEIDEESAKKNFPDKGQKLLVYCRSGIRSKDAAYKLAKLGYTNVYEFGGILNWQYGIE